MSEELKPDAFLSKIDGCHQEAPAKGWMDTPVSIRKGMYCYASNPKSVEYVGLPYARKWNPTDEDWKLPDNWKEIIHNGFKERLERLEPSKSLWIFVCDAAHVQTNATFLLARAIQKICRYFGRSYYVLFTETISPLPVKFWAD